MTDLFQPRLSPAISPPQQFLAMLEPSRAGLELMRLWLSAPILLAGPRGDGHSVLVLPGFGATDHTTMLLRGYLTFLGYHSTDWGLGQNHGYRTLGESEKHLRDRIRVIAAESGRKISVIGWSLGGVMARHMAREHPELIRQAITLGAPFTGDPTATSMRGYYEFMSGDFLDTPESRHAWRANSAPPLVPTTSIYSKTDGIIAWQNCLEVETPMAENVEVLGCHMGLPHNPMAYFVIADRLAQREDHWRPFSPAKP